MISTKTKKTKSFNNKNSIHLYNHGSSPLFIREYRLNVIDIITISTNRIIFNIAYSSCKQFSSSSVNYNDNCPFYISDTPQVNIIDFIHTLAKNSFNEVSTVILMFKYLERYCIRKKCILTINNIYKLIIASSIVAFKYNEDNPINISFLIKFTGLTRKELIYLETMFLLGIQYKLYVSNQSYELIEDFLVESL